MIYKTSLDGLAKTITVAVTVLFTVIIIAQLSPITSEGLPNKFFIPVLLGAIYFISFAFRPVKYEVTAHGLIIHRPVSDVKIAGSKIKSVEIIEKEKTSWAIRVFGVGGLFGYYGKFANRQLGSMTWYATRRDKIVLLSTIDGRKIILTPDDPERFSGELRKFCSDYPVVI